MAIASQSNRKYGSAAWGVAALLARPEMTAVVGTLVVFAFFAIFTGKAGFLTLAMTRNYLEVAAEIGIIAAPVTLLLVAGEFDLSVGSTVAASEVIIGYLTVNNGWPLSAALVAALAMAAVVGTINGFLVVKTQLPSFIITLAMLFIMRGAAQGGLRMLSGVGAIDGVRDASAADPLAFLFSSSVGPFSISLVWWILVTLLAAWVLDKTAFGNWIYAIGGSPGRCGADGDPDQQGQDPALYRRRCFDDVGSRAGHLRHQPKQRQCRGGTRVRGGHGGGDRRRAADGRLWVADRLAFRRAALRHGRPGLLLHSAAGRLVHDVPWPHASAGGVHQHLHAIAGAETQGRGG